MDANIIKTLEKALTDVNAPIGEHWGCGFLTTKNIKDTLDLLKQKDTEIDTLIRKKEALKDEIESLKEELFFAKQKRANIFELVESYGRGQTSGCRELEEKLEEILIEKYKKYHLIANNTQLKEGIDMFYQGRAEAIWECIGVSRNLVKEMTEQV